MSMRQTFRRRFVHLVIAGAAISGASAASAANGGPARLFELLDRDGDDRVTLAEVLEARQERRARLDLDGDGAVEQEEFVAGVDKSLARRIDRLEESQRPRAKRMLERLDSDGDGRVSETERSAWVGRMFERLDTNGDARLTQDETRARVERMFARADVNGDGAIDRQEAAQMRRRHGQGPAR